MTKPFLAPVLHDLRRLAETTDDRQQSDRQLLECYLKWRDETAFAVLVRRHGRLVLAACRRVLTDEADVEDAFQATFLVLLRRAGSVRWHESIGSWLFGVAHRIAVRARARAARRKGCEVQASWERPRPEQGPADLSWRESVGLLHEELDRLPDAFRMPLLLCCLDGKTRDEAAQVLGCSVGAIKGRLERGREMLRLRLTRRGLALSGTLLAALVDAPPATTAPASSLIQATLSAARTGRYSRSIAALVRAATSSFFTTKMRIAAGLLLAVSLLAVGGSRAFMSEGTSPATQPSRAAARPAEDASASVSLGGQVLNPEGKPVAGARLYFPRRLEEQRPGEGEVELVQRGTTDGKGRFRLQLPRAEVEKGRGNPLLAAADSFGVAWVDLPARDAPGELTLRLVKDVPIRGRLVTTEGKPVAGVTVSIAGLLAFERLDDFLRVYQREVKHADEGTGTRRLRMPLTNVLHIKPTDKDGRFEIRGTGVERVVGLEVKSAALGAGFLMVVTRESFDARAFEKGRLRGREERVPPLFGPSFEHVVERAEAGRAIEGTVREAGSGKAVPGATVAAAGASAITDAHGQYRLVARHKAAEYFLYVSAPQNGPWIGRQVRALAPPAAGQEPIRADVELIRGVVITGRIHDKATGKGVAGCSILFVPLSENKTAKTENLALNASSGDEGRFRLVTIAGPGLLLAQAGWSFKIDGVPIGVYKPAELDAADRRRIKQAPVDLDLFNVCKVVDVADRGPALRCDLALDPGNTLTVHLEDPDGKPVAGTRASGITSWTKRAIPVKTDRCRVYALDPDKPRAVAFVHIERKLAAVATLSGKEKDPVSVRLKPAGSIMGRVLDGDGQPLAGAEVYLVYATEVGRPFTESQGRTTLPRTDKEGRFRIEAIVPGLSVRTLGFLKGRQMLVPQPGLQIHPLESGQTLDVGAFRTKPRRS